MAEVWRRGAYFRSYTLRGRVGAGPDAKTWSNCEGPPTLPTRRRMSTATSRSKAF